jgi:hypothetical protein
MNTVARFGRGKYVIWRTIKIQRNLQSKTRRCFRMTVISVILALIGLFSTIAGSKNGWMILFFGVSAYMTIANEKKRKEAAHKAALADNAQLNCIWSSKLLHIAGLPLAEKAVCSVCYSPDKLTIEGGGTNFSLPANRITDISVFTDFEIRKLNTNSISGAVGGAVFFAPNFHSVHNLAILR